MPAPAETRTYNRFECVSFRTTDGKFGGLSNMAPGFPLSVNGISVRTSEALYQACRFPHLPDVQRLIIAESSPMTAKMKSKPFRKESRADWDAVRVKVMRWCLRVKLAQNLEKFGDLLLATGDSPIVEDSRKDDFWGAKPLEDGTLIGMNVLGRLLMELREQLRTLDPTELKHVEPLSIPNFVLLGQPIGPVTLSDGQSRTAVGSSAEWRQASSSYGSSGPHGQPAAKVAAATSETGPQRGTSIGGAGIKHPRRLIEVDMPLREISRIARREKLNAHGSLSTLHIWWARRPPAACRAVLAATLWPDPADPACPENFVTEACATIADLMSVASKERAIAELLGSQWQALRRFAAAQAGGTTPDTPRQLREALYHFIVAFSEPKAAQNQLFVEIARRLTTAAHPNGVVTWDPFAGGGTIPVEASRLGNEVIAGDLNPIPVILNRVVLESLPTHRHALTAAFSKTARVVGSQLTEALRELYPPHGDSTPIVYLWARQIRCEGPTCGVQIPLIRNLQVTRGGARWHYEISTGDGAVVVTLKRGGTPLSKPTVAGGAATCPACDFTTSAAAVRRQLTAQNGGAANARLLAVYLDGPDGRRFVEPTNEDRAAAAHAIDMLDQADLPKDRINTIRPYKNTRGLSAVTRVGIHQFSDLYTPRQALVLQRLRQLIRDVNDPEWEPALGRSVKTLLLCAMSRLVFQNCSLSRWHAGFSKVEGAFGKQALQVVWDFAESNPLADGPANWLGAVQWIEKVLVALQPLLKPATVLHGAAQDSVLPDDSVDVLFTDPPYFAAIPYSDLSNVFFVWERELLRDTHPDLYRSGLVDQDREIIVTDANAGPNGKKKDSAFFQSEMTLALTAARRAVKPTGVGVVVFADSTTDAWEAILGAIINSGWVITGSWPIDTELQNRTQAAGAASLQSSIHIVCRPRESPDGAVLHNALGEWRAVLEELPARIHEWMPRLAAEGVVGADAIFACLGPALEIFSRYSRVERASGEVVTLREYLEQVWAAVAREALSMIFAEPETAGLDEDARLTAMWLWTIAAPHGATADGSGVEGDQRAGDDEDDDEDDEQAATDTRGIGFTLDFDAARKIAQGLGARLEELEHVVHVKGNKARLLAVAERARYLFGGSEDIPPEKKNLRKKQQRVLFEDLEEVAEQQGWGEVGTPRPSSTALDRVHQSMLLFGAGRGEALKRFLVDEGIGRIAQFWKLAQALSALYPAGTNEKRWVDGVLARKKGLGI